MFSLLSTALMGLCVTYGAYGNGINESIKYVKYNNQKYIVDGHHRVIAAKRLGIKRSQLKKCSYLMLDIRLLKIYYGLIKEV